MKPTPRVYEALLLSNLAKWRQMAFVTGPRQVGKTTSCGAYPEPYREDIRDLTRIADISRMEVLGKWLAERSEDQLIYSNLAKSLRVSENTVRSWIPTLESRYYDFTIRPWFLVEVKLSSTDLSPNLHNFQNQLECPHAFQVVLKADYVEADCFSRTDPIEAPAKTFLSQLL